MSLIADINLSEEMQELFDCQITGISHAIYTVAHWMHSNYGNDKIASRYLILPLSVG